MNTNTKNITPYEFILSYPVSSFLMVFYSLLFTILSLILLSNFLFAQNLITKEIEINSKPTKITIVALRNSTYLTHIEYAKILGLQTKVENGKINLSSEKFQLSFLKGSSFFKISHRKFEEIKQLHLPVVEISNIYYLPYPTSLTLLDSADLINIIIEKNPVVNNQKTLATSQANTTIEDIIPDNLEQIKEIHSKVISKLNQKEVNKSPNSTEIKVTQQISEINKKQTKSSMSQNIPSNPISEASRNNQTHINDEIAILENPTNNKIIQPPPHETNSKSSKMTLPEIDTKKIDGYKIPKYVKRKKLQKLLGSNDI